MPERANVAVFEDNPTAQGQLRQLLAASGHQIVGDIAATQEEAEELIRLIATDQPDVILLDGNLRGITGEEIAKLLAQQGVKVPTIGISIDEDAQRTYLDRVIPKGTLAFKYIGEAITDL